jgi:hypothetical protein
VRDILALCPSLSSELPWPLIITPFC